MTPTLHANGPLRSIARGEADVAPSTTPSSLVWEAIPASSSTIATTASPLHHQRWYRARLPHGWLVQSVSERREWVGGREVTMPGTIADGHCATFIPFGPKPWD